MALQFQDKIALVTGSGRGIGRGIALHFARQGAHVVVNFFRNREPAEKTAAEIRSMGCCSLAVKANIGTIVVNAISPGIVLTEALQYFDDIEKSGLIEKAVAHSPVGRLLTPEDVAGVVAFLCSPAASMIRGQVIQVDGGYTLPIPGYPGLGDR